MAYRMRMDPTIAQAMVMNRHCADARFVWNLGLEQRGYWRRGRSTLSVYDQKKSLTEARQSSWLGSGSSVVQQQALFDLDRAFKNWWSNPAHFRRPTWRKAGQHEGFAIRDLTVKVLNKRWATVMVPKLGPVRFRLTRAFNLIVGCTSARVTCDRSGRWHVSFTSGQPPVPRTKTDSHVGLDMGVVSSVTTDSGFSFQMPVLLGRGEATRKVRLQRKLARQQSGSHRRESTKTKVARISARETDRRKNWIEQTTTALVRDYDLIAIEDLAVKNMTRSARGTVERHGVRVAQKRGLNRAIISQAWALFRTRLEQKSAAAIDSDGTSRPVIVVVVNPAYTSQRCSACRDIIKGSRESQAVFSCRSCGHTSNADHNAAINILAAGQAVTGRGAERKSLMPPGIEAVGREASTIREAVSA